MKELSEKSGLPRTAIHHYIREGLLPPARKTARNAATYGVEHLDRLALVQRLRDGDLGPASIDEVREVLALVEAGISPEESVRLVGEAGGVEVAPEGGSWTTIGALATAAGIASRTARKIESAGLLGGGTEATEATAGVDGFRAGDLLILKAAAAAIEPGDVAAEDLAPIADLIREVGNYTSTLEELARLRPVAGANTDVAELRQRVLPLCEALLWRALQSTETSPAPSSSDAERGSEGSR